MLTSTVLALVVANAATTFASPKPWAAPKPNVPSRIERRQEAQTYTCVLNAAATNSEYTGGMIPKRSPEDALDKRQSSDDFPLGGGGVAPNSFTSSYGITVGIAGATQPLWSSDDFNVWLGQSQTISASDTHLPSDITYNFAGPGLPTFGCSISYEGVDYDCAGGGSIWTDFVASSDTQTGQATFPCVMTPPGTTGGETYSPGWCTTHVVQYQKPDPATDPYKLDVTVYDAAGTPIGSVTGASSSATVDSPLPWTFDVGTENVDDDPVTFAYAGDTWDSNDSTNHQCSVGAYDSGSRQMDCGFTC